jgi:hypothetical protein
MQCNVLPDEEKIEALYGEASPEVEGRVRQHLEACPSCREELRGLRGTRARLSTWTLPETARPRIRPRVLPWALPVAAAALLALGGLAAYLGSEVRYEDGRVSVRIGVRGDEGLRRALAEQENRHAREIAALRAALAPTSPPAAGLRLADVQSLIRESEARQGQLFLTRLQDLRERTDAQRRIDLARVSAGLSYLDGKNGQQLARTSELMNTMLQASYHK